MNILLFQFRDDEVIKETEYNSFVQFSGLTPDQITSFDVLTRYDELTDESIPRLLAQYDGILIAGNGSESVTHAEEVPFSQHIKQVIQDARRLEIPTFAICFGAQFSALAFGGEVKRWAEMKEVGTTSAFLTAAGKEDRLLSSLPEQFATQQGHNDSITELPEGAVLLASSDVCPIQAFTFPNEFFYAVQFHPELGADEFIARLRYYQEYYSDNSEELEKIISTIKPSSEASALLERFVELIGNEEEIEVQ